MMTRSFPLLGAVAAAIAATAVALGDPSPDAAAYFTAFDRVEAALAAADGRRTPDNAMGGLAWGESYRWQGLVTAYEVTGEERYLLRLAGRIEAVLAVRDEVRGRKDEFRGRVVPGWGSTKYSRGRNHVWAVHTGMILHPMLRFTGIVRSGRIPAETAERFRPLADRVMEHAPSLLMTFDDEWREGPGEGEGSYTGPPDLVTSGTLPFNMQNAPGQCFLEMGRLTGEARWRDRAEKLARFFRNRMREEGEVFVWPYNLVSKGGEDISHASINVRFAVECARDGIVFTEADGRRLARTFLTRVLPEGEPPRDTLDGRGRKEMYPSAVGRWLPCAGYDPEVFRRVRTYYDRKYKDGAWPPVAASLCVLAELVRGSMPDSR